MQRYGWLIAGVVQATVAGWFADTATAQEQSAPPSLAGVWLATTPRSGLGGGLPALTPRAQADRDAFDPLDDPVIRCVMPIFPRGGFAIYPFEIVQTERMLVFLNEAFGMVRRIYMDGRRPPEYFPPARRGFSVGRWEGDELVVHTTHVVAGLLSGNGVRQYGDVSVVERYRLVDGGRGLEAEVTTTAPQTFVEPREQRFTWELDPDGMIFESVCDPADSRF